jgi:hypothetical protein
MDLAADFLLPHSGAISGSINAAIEMPFSKIRGESIIKWATAGFWGGVWGVRLGNRCPHTKIDAQAPQMI